MRAFEDENVIHVDGRVSAVDDVEVINLELALADLTQIERRLERLKKGVVSIWAVLPFSGAARQHKASTLAVPSLLVVGERQAKRAKRSRRRWTQRHPSSHG